MEGSDSKMIYSVFHILKKYQENVPCQLEQVTLEDLETFVSTSGKEDKEYDVLSSSYCSHVSNGNWQHLH